MMLQGIDRAYARAAKDYRHAVKMAMDAESPAAQRRHTRRAKTAARRMAELTRERAWCTHELEDAGLIAA